MEIQCDGTLLCPETDAGETRSLVPRLYRRREAAIMYGTELCISDE